MIKFSLNCHGKLLDLSTPIVMAIINLTPDSFYDGGSNSDEKSLLINAEKALVAGAKILDIGGQSTRPGAETISSNEEWERVNKAINSLRKEFPNALLSIDTFYSTVAEKAVDLGVGIVNDISGGSIDRTMFETIGRLKVPYILMHMKGTPTTMQKEAEYVNVVREIWNFFDEKIAELKSYGIEQLILDPGFGFGKKTVHNFSLLKNLNAFSHFNSPILVGLSRKAMITTSLKIKSDEALNGTSVLNTLAILNGASILRVHDVLEAQQVITLVEEYKISRL